MPPCPGVGKRGQKTVPGSSPKPWWGAREALLPAAAPGRPAPPWVPWAPERLSLPPGAGGGVLTVPGERAGVFLCPACVRGPGAPAAGRLPPSEVPLPPGSARIQETTPRAPSAPAPSARPDTALGVLRPGLGPAGGRRPDRPQGLRSMNYTASCWPGSRGRSRFRGHSSFLEAALFRSTGARLGLQPLGTDPLAAGQPGQAGQRQTTGGLADSALLSLKAALAHRGPGVVSWPPCGRVGPPRPPRTQLPVPHLQSLWPPPVTARPIPHSWRPCPDPLLQEVVPRGAVCPLGQPPGHL